MSQQGPTLSIGIPVYNGERYLAEAIDSHLSQDFTDFELIVADNGSTDATEKIVRSYNDPRISFHPSDRNRGAAWNFNRLVHLARGRYFKWSSYDDVLEPGFMTQCIGALERDRDAVICYPGVKMIDGEGRVVRIKARGAAEQATASERFLANVVGIPFEAIFGIIRLDAMRRTSLIGTYANSDIVLLAELALYGKIIQIEENLFRSRDHAYNSVRAAPSPAQRAAWFDTSLASRVNFPLCRESLEYFRAIRRVKLPAAERWRCYVGATKWIKWNAPRIIHDLKCGLRQGLMRPHAA